KNDPSLAARAMEESLRLDAPGISLWRIATRDTELGGVKIPKGAVVMIRMDSANRDERVFPNPEKFDIMRPNLVDHMSFRFGMHYCIGFRLAREQSAQSVNALLARLKDVRIVAEKSDLSLHPSTLTKVPRDVFLAFTPGRRLNQQAAE